MWNDILEYTFAMQMLIVDCRCFLDYNDSHIRSAVNAFYSKLMRRRLQENKVSVLMSDDDDDC